jgi:hypothetical protein
LLCSRFTLQLLCAPSLPPTFKLRLFGYDLNRSPPSSQVVNLLNIVNYFKKQGREEEMGETEILLGLSLGNARRFLQASEIFENISKKF